jgi:H+/Cl- antiporter ClcA
MAWKTDRQLDIAKMKLKLKDEKGMIAQIPMVFLFTIIWLSLFVGIVLAVIMAYFGNVYYELYSFKEDGKPTYFRKIITDINNKDKNQPLLGFTLFAIIGFVIWKMFSTGIF